MRRVYAPLCGEMSPAKPRLFLTYDACCSLAGEADGTRESGQRHAGALSLLGSLHEAAIALLGRAQHATQQALRAVDWPAGDVSEQGPTVAAAPQHPAAAQAATAVGPSGAKPEAEPGSAPAVPTRQQQWRLLRFAAQDWFERSWQVRRAGEGTRHAAWSCQHCQHSDPPC